MARSDETTTPAPVSPASAWHARSAAEVLAALGSSETGLANAEAARRLITHGPNRLAPPRRHGPVRRFLTQFHNVLIYVLLGAAGVTALLGHWLDTGVILCVALLNSTIGFLQEGKAERALDAIGRMLPVRAVARRDGRRREIDAVELVPGDIILLTAGDKVPADLRLLEVRALQIDEAALTGESEPVAKAADRVAADAPVGDRACMAFSGTLITSGHAVGVVVSTGDTTEIGHISQLVSTVRTLSTPLTRKMATFARWITAGILAFASLTFFVGVVLRDYSWGDMFMAAVSLAVAAIPEGLPAILTITLAVGVQRMAARNAIIRRLPIVETLGAVTVICSDKTGTLTRNEMTVQHVITPDGEYTAEGIGYAPTGAVLLDGAEADAAGRPDLQLLARAALLCNDADLHMRQGEWQIEGDPTEAALLTFAGKAGLLPAVEHKSLPRTDLIPFESEHRFMATLNHDHDGNAFVFVKGAPERLLAMCNTQYDDAGARPLDPTLWHTRIEWLAARGERVLAIAFRRIDTGLSALTFADVERGLVLLGLVGIIDPPRSEAISAIARCRAAGIRVKMITGDHVGTAAAIGRQLGIGLEAQPVTGAELEQLDADTLRRRVRTTDVFARASPEQKLRIVEALQANHEVVAMTGDGVNDAPALKRADVGIAMGIKGTEAAKEAAAMVLADDNFASIERAVEEGRTVYDNLKKSITFLLPMNGGESGALIAAIMLGTLLPITPIQILWINMVSSVALALALAFEPTEAGTMRRPPRPADEPILSGFLLWRVLLVTGLFVTGIFGMFEWALRLGASVEEARTVAVNTLVCMEVFYLFSVRFLVNPAFSLTGVRGTPAVLIAVGLVVALQSLFTYTPFMRTLFDSRPLDTLQLATIVLVGLTVLILLEIEKAVRLRFIRERS